MKEGEIISARVVAIHDYGVDIEAQGEAGFIQPIEVSWRDGESARALLREGEDVRVLVYACTTARFYASIKRANPEKNPWREPFLLEVGTVHEGVVSSVLDWGTKIRVGDLDAMILGPPSTGGVGSRVFVRIKSVDVDQRKLIVERTDEPHTSS